jgi:hypothetical protein
VVGSYLYSFNFEFEGAAAFVLEALGYSSETSYSVLSLGESLPARFQDSNFIADVVIAILTLLILVSVGFRRHSTLLLWQFP